MNRTEYMRQLESLLQNISATEREEALQYYNEYFNDAGPENEQNVIEALGNPAKVAENIKKDILWNGYGENSYQRAGADSRSVITYPADPQTENGNGEQRNRQSDASQTAQAQVVSPQKNEGMSTGMIVLIVILCILASPVILGAASAGIGVAAGLIAGWFGLIIGFGATAAALILVLIALVVGYYFYLSNRKPKEAAGSRDHQYVYASLCGNVPDRCRTDLRRCRTSVPDADRGHGGNRHTGDLLLDRRIIPEKR